MTEPTTDPVALLREAADKATPGPWFREYGDVILARDDPRDVAELMDECRSERVFQRAPHRDLRDEQAIADATLAAAARNNIDAVLDRLETAEAEVERAYQRGYSAGYGECMREWQTSR